MAQNAAILTTIQRMGSKESKKPRRHYCQSAVFFINRSKLEREVFFS
ncbi:hypothetical protein MGWOODY_Tha1073 [hydrothermal vent metagenome]|uniref:Uncharacterized protein n=1 Tax=hydrothermal vent metagenome TaxID=652676 RepID=A0A160TD29_9ZZZZ